MKIRKIIILFSLILLIIALAIVFSDRFGMKEAVLSPETPLEESEILETAICIIDDGKDSPKNYEIEIKEEITAFDLLKKVSEEASFKIKTSQYEYGIFIEAIGGVENGQDGKYWLYYLNGQMPSVAADKQLVKPGDRLEFRFEESPF